LDSGGEEVAVDSIDATIEEGEFATVVGPSGCGKTTFLRMISGLETPTDGEIHFDDELVTNLAPQDRGISMVFQSIALFPFKTVGENIQYGLKYADVDSNEVNERVEEMSEMVGIEELLDKKPPQLSGGQQQRAALARALIRDPEVFLLDEPLSDLDAKLKTQMRTELKELHRQIPKTTIYVTHDQEEAMTLSDSVIVMNDGQIMQKSPPNEIYNEPENVFVARFMGSPSINVFEGELGGNAISSQALHNPIAVGPEMRERISSELSNGSLDIGVRPRNLSLTEDASEADLSGTTKVFEQMGDATVLHLSLDTVPQELRVVIPPERTPDEDETFHLTFEAEDVHLFDGVTGETITNSLAAE
jgi:multiple sugar transport system ATP-binding protein